MDRLTIWTPTKEEFKKVQDFLFEEGWAWSDTFGSGLSERSAFWDTYKFETCISPTHYTTVEDAQKKLYYSSRTKWIELDCLIIDLSTYQKYYHGQTKEAEVTDLSVRRVRLR